MGNEDQIYISYHITISSQYHRKYYSNFNMDLVTSRFILLFFIDLCGVEPLAATYGDHVT